MKKLVTTVLAATLATSIIAPQAQAKEDIKVKNSKLVDAKGNVVKGFKTYKGKLYKNGKLFKGVYKGKFYSKGKKSSGTFKGVKYRKGAIFTGKSVDGNYYDGGQIADGVASNGIMYDNGLIYTGSFAGVDYVDGKPAVDNKVDEPVVDDKEDDQLPPVVDENKPTEDNNNSNNDNNDNNTTIPEVIIPVPNPTPVDPKPEDNNNNNGGNTTTPTTPEETKPTDNNNNNETVTPKPDDKEETKPTPPVEEVKPPVTEPEKPSDNGNNNTEEESDELVLVDGNLYVNPKTGVHYVNGEIPTKPYPFTQSESKGYFFTSDGKLETVYSVKDYGAYFILEVEIGFYTSEDSDFLDVSAWNLIRDGYMDRIMKLPDSKPRDYLLNEYAKAEKVYAEVYAKNQESLKAQVYAMFDDVSPQVYNNDKPTNPVKNLLAKIDDEDFKKKIMDMITAPLPTESDNN